MHCALESGRFEREYRVSFHQNGEGIEGVSRTLRLDDLGKRLHEPLHLFERTETQPKAAVNHRLAPHITDQDALLAQGAFNHLTLAWRPDEQIVAALPKISHAQTPELLRHPLPGGVDLLDVPFDIGTVGERGFSGNDRKGVNIIGAGNAAEPTYYLGLANGKA